MSLIIPPIPMLSPVLQQPGPNERPPQTLSEDYYRWLEEEVRLRLQNTAPLLASISLTGQSASIGATTLWSTTQAGLYRVSLFLRITTVDAVSSSATVTISWTDGGVAQSKSYAAVNGNLTTSWDSQSLSIHADAATSIRYAVVYASNTPGSMKFRADLSVEQLS